MAVVINGSGTVTGLAVGGLPDGTVDAGTLATDSVTNSKITNGAVDAAALATDSVVTGKIADGTIANADIADLAASKLTGALPAISGASLTGITTGKVLSTFKQVDATNRSFSTSWAIGTTWNNFTKSSGSSIMFHSTIPCRNDSTGWGGFYCRVEYSINNGSTWVSLGDTGYDTVMEYGQSIGHWNASQLIDLAAIVNSTQVRFRFQHRSYNGTVTIRQSNGLNHGIGYGFGNPQLTLLEIGA